MSYDEMLTAAKKAVSLAARLSNEVRKSLLVTDVWNKSDDSPVTVADYGSQAVVSLVLERELKNEPVSLVAEEDSGELRKIAAENVLARITELVKDTLASDESYAASPLSSDDVLNAIDRGKSEGGPKGRHWILDPIGGTRGFIRGEQYAIGLALLVEGKVVLGVMACPKLPFSSTTGNTLKSSPEKVGCLFYGSVGTGTYVQSLSVDSLPVKVEVSSVDDPAKACFFESYHTPVPIHNTIAKKLGIKDSPIKINSQTKYAALSRGDGEVYLRFTRKPRPESIWNHAAGSIIVSEAGGKVTDAAGDPLDFSKGKYLDYKRGIVVTTQKLLPRLLKAVRESIKEEEEEEEKAASVKLH
ncbi:PREDICTED: probable SAL3 phosphatase [Camelina sativa]|uniref:3'(2'),5'-bisphosphate nucleotidase n=1 Tax=Camelina sativa TaxID=90675 RepID=A0ABM0XD59_CAMSA|nr:PREDICTED: probable SAL3 phosphatase [Camelina sativa]